MDNGEKRKRNSIIEKGDDKRYFRQNFVEKIVISPIFIEVF